MKYQNNPKRIGPDLVVLIIISFTGNMWSSFYIFQWLSGHNRKFIS